MTGKLNSPITAGFNEDEYAAVKAWANSVGLAGSRAVRLLTMHALKDPPSVEAVRQREHLTRQQRAVFDLCAAGKSNSQIAVALCISKQHVSVLISKLHARGLDVPNRARRPECSPAAARAELKPKPVRIAAPPPSPQHHEPWKPGDPKPEWLRRAG